MPAIQFNSQHVFRFAAFLVIGLSVFILVFGHSVPLVEAAFDTRYDNIGQLSNDCKKGLTYAGVRPTGFDSNKCGAEEQKFLNGLFNQQNNDPALKVSCEGTLNNLKSPWTCFWRWSLSWIGASFIWVGVKIATIAGGIFEWSITYTIVKFGEYLQILRPAIDAGWTGLRDVANIVIIGLFVFVAINIILGVKEFGERRAVAKILIVAVLINFSLLFTKIIVDASNFTAYQFYNSMIKGTASQSVTLGPTDQISIGKFESKISGSFMKFLGAEGIFDSQEKLKKVTENNENALYALLYGLLGLIFLLATSAVFLYGAFLIISRAVLIIFLMLTSALAFASWIIPNQFISDGWEKWWKSLLKSAFFAPILMAFLWMTLRVSQELSKALMSGPGAKGTLGALAENASSQANLVALLNFALIIGLLYASFAAASAFSSTISGFRFAKAGVGGAIFGSLAGASRLGGMFGRNTLGWAGQAGLSRYRRYVGRPDDTDDTGRTLRSYEGRRTGITGVLNRGILRSANYLATSRFDALQKGPVRSAFGTMGGTLTKSFVQKTEGLTKDDFRSAMEKKAQKADTVARAIGPTPEQQNALRQQTQQQINTQAQGFQQMVDTQQRTLRQVRAQERPGVEAAVRTGQDGRGDTERDARDARQQNSEVETNLRDVERRIESARRNAAAGGTVDQAELDALMRRQTDLQGQAPQLRQNLEAATRALDGLNRQAQELAEIQLDEHANVRQARGELQRREADLRTYRERTQTLANDAVAAQDQRLREQLLWDRRARPFVAGEMRGQAGRRALRDLAAEVRSGNPPAAPAAPPAAAPPRTP